MRSRPGDDAQRLGHIAHAGTGDALGLGREHAVALHERLLHVVVAEPWHLHHLCAATDGLQHLVGLLAHQQEDGECWGLLEELQQFVGTLGVHALGQPDDHDLISALARLQAELAQDGRALVGVDEQLLVVGTDGVHPLAHAEVGAVVELFAPFLQEVVAVGVLAAVLLEDGEHEVEVGVLQLLGHRPVAQESLRVCHGNGQSAASFGSAEHEGMGHASLTEFVEEALLHGLLCYDLVEGHCWAVD